MRKSNWIILGILAIASIIFLVMWNTLGFNLVDDPFDLILTICWWVLIIVICVIIQLAENKRRRSIRTTFIAPGLIYNSEVGVIKLRENDKYASAIKKVLKNLNYGFDRKEIKNEAKIRFKYIVHTDKFTKNGNVWEGDVVKVSNPGSPKKFSNETSLTKLLEHVNA